MPPRLDSRLVVAPLALSTSSMASPRITPVYLSVVTPLISSVPTLMYSAPLSR